MKKFLSILVVLVMVLGVFAGCQSDSKQSEDPSTAPSKTETTDKAEDKAEESGDSDIGEFVTLKWYLHGSNVKDDTAVLEKANAYLKEKLNCEIQPIWGTWGDFDENVVLAINGNDDVDIYFTCSWSANEYNSFAKRGAYRRLDDPDNNLIEQYGQDLWDLLPDVLLNGAMVQGADGYGAYAVPGYKDIATQNRWDINVPLLEKYGYTLEDIENTDYYGFGEIMKTVKEGEGDDFYPLLVEGAVLERMVTNSIIVTGDSGNVNVLSLYLNPDNLSEPAEGGTTIFNKFATPEYQRFVETTREYFLAGYIDPGLGNAGQANDLRTAKQQTGEYLIGTQSYALGYEVQASAERGFEVGMVPATDPYVDTTSSQGAMMAISTASKNPERAMMFLNLLNTDPELFTLLDYGVEGVHYDLVNGEAVFTEARENYMPWTNGMGNVTLLPPQEGQGADFYDDFKAYYGAAEEIPSLGWAFDPTVVENEMGALTNVASEYSLALSTGTVDPAEKLPEFLQKLEDNGMQKVVDEANSQLDSFMEAKGN